MKLQEYNFFNLRYNLVNLVQTKDSIYDFMLTRERANNDGSWKMAKQNIFEIALNRGTNTNFRSTDWDADHIKMISTDTTNILKLCNFLIYNELLNDMRRYKNPNEEILRAMTEFKKCMQESVINVIKNETESVQSVLSLNYLWHIKVLEPEKWNNVYKDIINSLKVIENEIDYYILNNDPTFKKTKNMQEFIKTFMNKGLKNEEYNMMLDLELVRFIQEFLIYFCYKTANKYLYPNSEVFSYVSSYILKIRN